MGYRYAPQANGTGYHEAQRMVKVCAGLSLERQNPKNEIPAQPLEPEKCTARRL